MAWLIGILFLGWNIISGEGWVHPWFYYTYGQDDCANISVYEWTDDGWQSWHSELPWDGTWIGDRSMAYDGAYWVHCR